MKHFVHKLIEEVIRENPSITSWWMADVGVEDRSVMAAFMLRANNALPIAALVLVLAVGLLTTRRYVQLGQCAGGFVTGMLAAIFVAFRPEWLATWSDQLYLKRPPQ